VEVAFTEILRIRAWILMDRIARLKKLVVPF